MAFLPNGPGPADARANVSNRLGIPQPKQTDVSSLSPLKPADAKPKKPPMTQMPSTTFLGAAGQSVPGNTLLGS